MYVDREQSSGRHSDNVNICWTSLFKSVVQFALDCSRQTLRVEYRLPGGGVLMTRARVNSILPAGRLAASGQIVYQRVDCVSVRQC